MLVKLLDVVKINKSLICDLLDSYYVYNLWEYARTEKVGYFGHVLSTLVSLYYDPASWSTENIPKVFD